MKLVTVFMIAVCLQVSAKGLSQKITIRENNITLQKVFEEIRKQTNYQFFYADEALKTAKTVSLSVKRESLEKVLNICFKNQQLDFSITDNTIIVKRKTAMPVVADAAFEEKQDITVKGKVTDDKGQPLTGVSVSVKGTATGTTTNAEGNYSLSVPDDAVLLFSYVGFVAVEQKVSGNNTININLKSAETPLDAVVVVGYGTQKKRDLTGSISSVKGDELSKMPSTNPVSSLQGKVPGLTVSNSGRAGSSPVVRIRGVNSTNSANPVYVIDGILHDNIDFLNPADIESMDILRDPSSIAIYGLRGANGVIAVTSKKAARGKTTVSLHSAVSLQKVHDKIALTDAAGFKKLFSAQLANTTPAGTFDFTNYTGNTDWQDQILRNAMLTSTNVSVSNNNDKTTTYLNLGFTNQEGVLKNDEFTRYLIRLNEEIRISKNIKIGGDVTGYHYLNNPPSASITNALWAAPVVPTQLNAETYYSMPSFQRAQVGNPVATLNRGDRNSVQKGYRFVGNVFAEIKFLKSFTWKSIFYTDLEFFTNRNYSQLPFKFINLGEFSTPTSTSFDTSARTSVGQDQRESRRIQQDHTLAFDKKLGKGHSINLLAGVSMIKSTSSFIGGTRRDLGVNIPDDPDYWYLNISNAENPSTNEGGGAESSIVGTFGRVSYSYKNRYLLNATIRRDGSSKFAIQNRWGTFGSIGAGWIVSDEHFFNRVKAIDFFKLRAAWGSTGNANGFPDNLYRPGIQNSNNAVFGDNVYPAIQATHIVDSNLHWEVVNGIDLGFDLRAIHNKLNVEVTLYNRTTKDILTSVSIPNDSRKKFTNLGSIANKGIEINIGWNDVIGNLFTYSVGANFSYNHNVVSAIGNNFNFELLGNGGINRTNTGKSIGYFYGYKQIGIYQTAADLVKKPGFSTSQLGDIIYADKNGDGIISAADRDYLGTPFPPYSFGANFSLGYKEFDLGIDAQGSAGHKIYVQRRTATFATLNYEANRLNAWTGVGTSNVEPILDNNRGNNFLMSSYFLEPGDYFRIRNVQFGYTFSAETLSKIGIQKARVYVSGQNLKTWSKVTGYSPEPLIGDILGGGADNGSYPVPAIYSLGLNITF